MSHAELAIMYAVSANNLAGSTKEKAKALQLLGEAMLHHELFVRSKASGKGPWWKAPLPPTPASRPATSGDPGYASDQPPEGSLPDTAAADVASARAASAVSAASQPFSVTFSMFSAAGAPPGEPKPSDEQLRQRMQGIQALQQSIELGIEEQEWKVGVRFRVIRVVH